MKTLHQIEREINELHQHYHTQALADMKEELDCRKEGGREDMTRYLVGVITINKSGWSGGQGSVTNTLEAIKREIAIDLLTKLDRYL
ncbi:MAG: hypothetical protein K0U20_08265 [Proteobacteria bacterium]|nr:hypothetical protein [Pseudomonadota bacterium]